MRYITFARPYAVYILRLCSITPRGLAYYIGATGQIIHRLFKHASGRGSSITSRHGVVEVLSIEHYATAQEALQREQFLQRKANRQKLHIEEPCCSFIDLAELCNVWDESLYRERKKLGLTLAVRHA